MAAKRHHSRRSRMVPEGNGYGRSGNVYPYSESRNYTNDIRDADERTYSTSGHGLEWRDYPKADMMQRRSEDRREGKGMQWAEYYAGVDPRRRQEMLDGSMISEDHRAIANLPQHVVMREYPKAGHTMAPYIDDTIEGIDRQMDYDDMMKRRIFAPKKL